MVLFLAVLPAVAWGQTGTWQRIESSPQSFDRWDAMSFIHPDTGWIAGTSGSGMYRTVDGGSTWQRLSVEGDLRALAFADALTGWLGVLGSNAILRRTTDGGQTWQSVSSARDSGAAAVCGVQVLDSRTMMCVGPFSSKLFGKPHFTRTDDGVTYRTTVLSDKASGLVDVSFRTPAVGLIGGSVGGDLSVGFGIVLRTVDSGRTWTEVYRSNRPGTQLWKFQRKSDGVIVAAVEGLGSAVPYFVQSADDGVTWTEGVISPVRDTIRGLQSIGFVSPNEGWVGGRWFSAMRTLDGGATWAYDSTDLWAVNRFQFFGDTLGYAAGSYVYRWRPGVTSVPPHAEGGQGADVTVRSNGDDLDVHIHSRFDVRQCFVYDVLGRLVSTQVGTAGRHHYRLPRNGARGPLFVVVSTTVDYLNAVPAP